VVHLPLISCAKPEIEIMTNNKIHFMFKRYGVPKNKKSPYEGLLMLNEGLLMLRSLLLGEGEL
jgi:hypothetical protein